MALKIQTTAYAALEKGLSNEEVLELVKKRHPNAHTTINCISYYRSKMNATRPADQRIPQKAKVVGEISVPAPVALQKRLIKATEKLIALEQEIYELEQQVHSVNAA